MGQSMDTYLNKGTMHGISSSSNSASSSVSSGKKMSSSRIEFTIPVSVISLRPLNIVNNCLTTCNCLCNRHGSQPLCRDPTRKRFTPISGASGYIINTAMCVNLNIDGAPIASRSPTHPSHSQTSRFPSTFLSLGTPFPRST